MPIEHPEPTTTTVKFLYAHAFRCAYEGCKRPLYKVDEQTGDRVLNSRVCHINARREGGPRWDPDQTTEENRSKQNLVLMCIEHAAAIDESATLSGYPAVLLREWKVKQLEEYDRLLQGWKINADMAQEALKPVSFNAELAIVDSIVSLGGQGGGAPSSGGGGGGAIGRGARAGRGGDGGGHRIDSGEYTLPWTEDDPSPPTSLHPGFVPGAGGGGAGAIGENAIAGDGGGGGERVSGLIDLVPLRAAGLHHIEFTVGEGGFGARLPGQHASSGDDTVLNFVTEDGTVLKSVRAKGGSGAKSPASYLPLDTAELSREDINQGFRVSVLMTARAAEFCGGTLFVLGGGWANFLVPHLPIDVALLVVCGARWRTLGDTRLSRGLFRSLVDPYGDEASSQLMVVPAESLGPGNWTWVQPIGATIDAEGTWLLRVHSGGFLLAEIDFQIAVPPP